MLSVFSLQHYNSPWNLGYVFKIWKIKIMLKRGAAGANLFFHIEKIIFYFRICDTLDVVA